MRRLNVFVKGNVDVHDSLDYSRVAGKVQWNGLNIIVRERHPELTVRIRHEVCARWDRMGIEGDEAPSALADLPLGAYNLEAQFQSKLLAEPWDAYVLSVQADIFNTALRHRDEDWRFVPANWHSWTPEQHLRLREECENLGVRTPAESMASLAHVVGLIRARCQAPILVYNLSSVVPGETTDARHGISNVLSRRIRAYNAALDAFAADADILVVDVDQVIARAGADRVKIDALHFTKEGYRLMAAEVMRIFEMVGLFDGDVA